MVNNDIIEEIKRLLMERKQSLSVAESVTAGFLQAALASANLALQFFEGGITAYNIEQKVMHLKIDKQKGEECNCVSAQTADEMASGACNLFHSDWGISTTGYSTPVPESEFKLFGYFSICFKNEIKISERIDLDKVESEKAQLKYVNIILERFKDLLSGR